MSALEDCFECLCRVMAGSMRIIMFICCVLLMLIETLVLIGLVSNFGLVDVIGLRLGTTSVEYIFTIGLLLVSVVGCYAAYHDHPSSLKVFAFSMALSSVLLFVYFRTQLSAENFETSNDKLFKPLSESMPDYDWLHQDQSEKEVEATKKWDQLQTADCCGIDGPDDWDKFRPKNLSADLYPGTCCRPNFPQHQGLENGLCKKEEVFQVGCLIQVEEFEAVVVLASYLYIGFQILLLIISLLCLCKCCYPNESQTTSAAYSW